MVQQSPQSLSVIEIFSALSSYFLQLPLAEKIVEVDVWIFIIVGFNLLMVTPIVFNYFIIPNIERKVGKKLEFHWYNNMYWFGDWSFRSSEVLIYIVKRYIALKINLHIKSQYKNSALAKVDYDIRTASKFEIGMSFFSFVNMLLGIMAMVSGLLINNVLKLTHY